MYILIVITWVADIYRSQQFRDASLFISIIVEERDAAAMVVKNEVVSENSFIL